MKKPVPIGYEDIKEIVEKDYYYVDKTAMLADFLSAHSKVTLFTRPRRFGKTLNQSMFRRFFEDERNADGGKIDNGSIFVGLDISNRGETYLCHQQGEHLHRAEQSGDQFCAGAGVWRRLRLYRS